MPAQPARQTAIPCMLSEVALGIWVQNEGLMPSGVNTPRGFVSRVSILGVIVAKPDESSITIEDGSGAMNVRSFDAKPVPVRAQVGDIVLVIGRPREYNGERYLVLEICKKIKNPAWVLYRKRELELLTIAPKPVVIEEPAPIAHQEHHAVVTVQETKKNPFELIVEKIRELDAGSGVDIEELLPLLPDADKFIRTLIEEGEIFEIRPGRLKVLE